MMMLLGRCETSVESKAAFSKAFMRELDITLTASFSSGSVYIIK
jgi:hypothetical protein